MQTTTLSVSSFNNNDFDVRDGDHYMREVEFSVWRETFSEKKSFLKQ